VPDAPAIRVTAGKHTGRIGSRGLRRLVAPSSQCAARGPGIGVAELAGQAGDVRGAVVAGGLRAAPAFGGQFGAPGSDYAAGLAARQASVVPVTVLAEVTSVVLLLAVVPFISSQAPPEASRVRRA